jgi:hypothetical protein
MQSNAFGKGSLCCSYFMQGKELAAIRSEKGLGFNFANDLKVELQ